MGKWSPQPNQVLDEAEIMTYVLNVSRCIPYFCEPTSSALGQIGMFLPMFVAATYFSKYGHWKMLKWIGHVKDKVFTIGMQLRNMKAGVLSTPIQ